MIQSEVVRYSGISPCDVRKQLELQQWILDPSSRPYDKGKDSLPKQVLHARSAGVSTNNDKSVVQKLLELQRRILGTD